MNEARADETGITDSFYPEDVERFSVWLEEDEGLKSTFPNWQDCTFSF